MKLIATAAVAATLAAAPAAAQDRVIVTTTHHGGYVPAPYPPAPQRAPYMDYEPLPTDAEVFGGLRIEVQAGYDRLEGDIVTDDGVTYGAEAGFDVALGRSLLVGGYAGVEGSTVEACSALIGATNCYRTPLALTLGGRVGVTLGHDTLLYAKGGYTRGRVAYESARTTLPPSTFEVRQNLDGWHVGGGLERRFTRNAYGKVEYVYTRLRGLDVTTLPGPTEDLDRHQVKVGLGLRM